MHRFADKCRHFVRADGEDFVFELARHAHTEIVFALACAPVLDAVRLVNMNDTGNRQIALLVHTPHAAQRRTAYGRAVVGVVPGDDGFALRLPQRGPVMPHHADIGVVALRARAGKKHVAEMPVGYARRETAELGRQPHRRHIGGIEKAVVVGQLHHLQISSLRQFRSPVTDVDAPQSAHGVQQFFAFRIPDVNIVSVGNDARALGGQALRICERVHVMRAVERLHGRGIHLAALDGGRRK